MGWLDDNNPGTVLAPRPALPTEYSERLRPASAETFRNELTACLALVAPVGMTEEARGEWLAVAWETLKHLPPDLLARGCSKARAVCDHPSKIVPAIIAETEEQMKWRRSAVHADEPSPPAPVPPERRIETPMTAAEIEEMNSIMPRIGLATRYRPDGTRFQAETAEQRIEARGPRRKPTRADYLEMGVDPAILDQIQPPEGDRP